MVKNKKKKQKDFQKVKLKVGKKLKKADNVTNASFKSRSIQISQQLKTADTTQPTTKRKQNIQELLSHCRHYSPSVRHEAVTGLREILTSNPETLHTNLSDILERCFELMSDKDSVVRRSVIKGLLKLILPLISEKQIVPFFPLLCAHLCCAMTHINDGIKVDSLLVLDKLLDYYPKLMISKSNQVLVNFIEQISQRQGEGHLRSLSTNPDSETSSVQWRVSVLNRLQKFLDAVLLSSMDGQKDEKLDVNDITWTFMQDQKNILQAFPSCVKTEWDTHGFMLRQGPSQDMNSSAPFLNDNFQQFAVDLVPLLLECWVEATSSENSRDSNKPTGRHRKGQSSSVSDHIVMYNVVKVTQLLWECVHLFITAENEEKMSLQKYEREFEAHFMRGFPYTASDAKNKAVRKGKKDKKKKDVTAQEQVSSEMLNLTICDVMTNLIADAPEGTQSTDWLAKIIRYLTTLLQKQDGPVGQNARVIVRVLDRLCRTGFLADEAGRELLAGVFHRYQSASPLSAEKRTYLYFFSGVILQDNSTVVVSEKTAVEFLQSLPDLLPLCVKQDPQMAAHIISVMKKACCENCKQLLEGGLLTNALNKFFDAKEGCITSLKSPDQRELMSLLYFLPNIENETLRQLVLLCRSEALGDPEVVYLIQVLHNRYLRQGEDPGNALLHISVLGSLLLGSCKADLEVMCTDPSSEHPLLQPVRIVNPLSIDSDQELKWQRHFCIVEAVCDVMRQCCNTEQVLQVLLSFMDRTLNSLKLLPLQAVYSMCRLAESFPLPVEVVSLVLNASISLVNVFVTWEGSTNQNLAERMIDTGCDVLLGIDHGMKVLFTTVIEKCKQDISDRDLQSILKTVLLFFTEKYKAVAMSDPENVELLMSLQAALSRFQVSLTEDTKRLLEKFTYHVSLLK